MKPLPTISIVVPSFNQAQYLSETLESLVQQAYPKLEVIIQEGGSNDGSIEIANDFVRRHPDIFRLFVETDEGQADALNRGFARTRGEIMAFLNSDDTYFPGTLHRVADEIDPAKDRYVVMGRCLFTGEGSPYVGVEHPAEYGGHYDLLAIWKRGYNTIPQPSVFWHRNVWKRCGGLDIDEHHALDYDLFCRFSRYYTFHRVDALFSNYRMHASSKSSQRSEAEVLAISIKVSRKHWGGWFSPLRWHCTFSLWLHNRQLHERARHHSRQAEDAFLNRRYWTALVEFMATLVTSPRIARDRLVYGWLTAKGMRLFDRLAVLNEGFTGRYADGWIGPLYREQIAIPENGEQLSVRATHYPQHNHKKIRVKLRINGKRVASKRVSRTGTFSLLTDMKPYRGNSISIELKTNSCFSPGDTAGVDDPRRLSLFLEAIDIIKK